MSTPQFILQALFFIMNSFALFFIVLFVCKMHKLMNDKLDQYLSFTKHVSDRNDVIYLNQLVFLKEKLVSQDRFEEADSINKIIQSEINKLKQNGRL